MKEERRERREEGGERRKLSAKNVRFAAPVRARYMKSASRRA